MRKWRNGTFLSLGRELTVLTQEQADYIGVKIGVPFKDRHYRYWVQGSAERVTACSDGENRRGSRSGRTLRVSSSSAGRPRHESSIAKNYFEIELDREELFAIDLDMD